MYEFSSKTKVNKVITFAQIFKEISADKEIKQDAKIIKSIMLSNVLADYTLNLPKANLKKEIYVFEIELTEKKIPLVFLTAMDKKLGFYSLFRFVYQEQYMYAFAYKSVKSNSVSIGKYHYTEWQNISSEILEKMPIFSSVDDLYYAIIVDIIRLLPRRGETVEDYLARYGEILSLQKEIDRLDKIIRAEKQTNIVYELNEELKTKKKQIEELKK